MKVEEIEVCLEFVLGNGDFGIYICIGLIRVRFLFIINYLDFYGRGICEIFFFIVCVLDREGKI